MKKTFLFILAIAILSTACNKQKSEEDKPGEGKMVDLVFSAKACAETKTAIDGSGNVNWVKDDAINIIWGTGDKDRTTSTATTDGSSTTFTATVLKTEKYYAVYPASVVASKSSSEEYELLLNVPKTQRGTFASCNITLASTTKDDMSLSFQNLCALVKFTITQSNIEVIYFNGNNNESVVGDGVQVTLGDDPSDAPSVGEITTPRIQVIVKPESGTFAAGVYYIGILPGTFSKGFEFTCKDSDGNTIARRLTSDNITFARSTATDVGVIDKLIYVTPGGSGDGSSWGNAMGVTGLRELLSSTSATAEATRIAKLNNATICFDGGTTSDGAEYILAETNPGYLSVSFSSKVTVNFEGGYDATTGKRNGVETRFAGGATKGSSTNVSILSLGDNVEFTFDKIAFKKTRAIAGAINVARGALTLTSASAIVHINSCKFQDNIEDAVASSGSHGGSAIFISNGEAYVRNTLFKSNKSRSRGGAIRTENGTLFMDRCQFVDNDLKCTDAAISDCGEFGMALFSKCSLGLNNCTFWGGVVEVACTTKTDCNNPIVNVNNNFIMSNNTIIGVSVYSSGTGVVRSETTGNYTGLMINNIIINSSTTGTSWGMLFSKTDKKTLSEGSNLYSGVSGGVSHTTRVDLSTSDKNVTDYKTLGNGLSYSLNSNTNEVDWTGTWTGYSKADATTVKTAIEQHPTLGTAFSTWLGL